MRIHHVHGVTDGMVAAIYALVMATKQRSKHCEVIVTRINDASMTL
jgi:hypothetical protein